MFDPDTLFGVSLIEGFISRPTGDRQLVRGYDVLIELVCFIHEDMIKFLSSPSKWSAFKGGGIMSPVHEHK
jgi:hypothetical protein